ncbi:hypothetical protein OSTOST_02720 [Ostertagia ostertagi]
MKVHSDTTAPDKEPMNPIRRLASVTWKAFRPPQMAFLNQTSLLAALESSTIQIDMETFLFGLNQFRMSIVYDRKFDSADFSEAWKQKFSHAPTWCDADMSLQQINRDAQRKSNRVVCEKSILYTICCYGLKDVVIETDIVKLWVQQGGRLSEEMNFLDKVRAEANRISKRDVGDDAIDAEVRRGPDLPRENGLGGGFQLVIQTPVREKENVLSKESLLRHVKLMEEISKYELLVIGVQGRNGLSGQLVLKTKHRMKWTLSDICFKPPSPKLTNGPLAKLMNSLLDKMIPCIWITPIDCYWEGSKPLGPDPPINLGEEISGFVTSLPKGNVSWKNLNPTAVMAEAGIGAAYTDRPCIEPLDPECPKTSPNYFDRCTAMEKFNEWNMAKPDAEKIQLERKPYQEKKEDPDSAAQLTETIINDIFGRKKRDAPGSRVTTGSQKPSAKDEDYYAYEDSDYDVTITNASHSKHKMDPKELMCLEYGESLLKWMSANRDRWGEFLTQKEMPKDPDYDEVMTGGCKGFGKTIMEWPEDLIIGGIKRSSGKLSSAEALQRKERNTPNLDVATWNPGWAADVVFGWQRNFTKRLYGHEANKNTEERVFHPLASTSIADMLEEFSQFNYTIIILGYVLMQYR